MARSIDSFNKRRLITSYFSVIVSITLVLFLMGFFSFLVLSANKLANYFKEQVTVTVLIKDDAKNADIEQLQKTLSVASFVKSVRFVSKEVAAEKFSKDIGEDFVTFIGTNPLQNTIDLSLKAELFCYRSSIRPIFGSSYSRKCEQNRYCYINFQRPIHFCIYLAYQCLYSPLHLFQTFYHQNNAISRGYAQFHTPSVFMDKCTLGHSQRSNSHSAFLSIVISYCKVIS